MALSPLTDGVLRLRPPTPADVPVLIAGRDDERRRWLGPGSDAPEPTACIEVDGRVVGWVDHERGQEWLGPGEVNVGYELFPAHRGRGLATRAVQLLMHHLAHTGAHHTATLSIDPGNARSLALASRTRFVKRGEVQGKHYFRRRVPPLVYSDGVVTIRRPRVADADAQLTTIDDEQIRWLWRPGEREQWAAKTPEEQRAHTAQFLRTVVDAFACGPKWTFSVDTRDAAHVALVDCDLAKANVAPGTANIAYACHPAHRGHGYVTRAVRLLLKFLAEHTGAREAHILVDPDNLASLRVASAIGATAVETFTTADGERNIRHVVQV